MAETTARSWRLDAVILQKFDAGVYPTAYTSHMLSPAEHTYPAREQESPVNIFPLEKFDTYFDRATLTIPTEHKNFSLLKYLKNTAGGLARWAVSFARNS